MKSKFNLFKTQISSALQPTQLPGGTNLKIAVNVDAILRAKDLCKNEDNKFSFLSDKQRFDYIFDLLNEIEI